MQQRGLIIIPSHRRVQRHEAHTVMTQAGLCLGMLHSINKIVNLNYDDNLFHYMWHDDFYMNSLELSNNLFSLHYFGTL